MNSLSNNLEKNQINFDYSNSLIHILYSPNKELNKRCVYKNHNDVIISYKDTVINKTIYVTSNGLKKNSIFTSEDFDKILAKKELNTFVSYFKIFEDKLFKFDLYPKKYKKVIEVKFLKSQGLIQKVNRRSLITLRHFVRSKFINKHKLLNQRFVYNGSFDKKIIIKLGYRKIFAMTSRGVRTPQLEYTNYNALTIASGAFFHIKRDMKHMMKIIYMSSYILFRFFTKAYHIRKKNINLFLNVLIYYYFAKFNFNSFFERKDELKVKWKKSNKFPIKFFLRTQRKFNKFINTFFQLTLNTFIFKLSRSNYLNNLPLYKDENFFHISNKLYLLETKTAISTFEDKINLLNYLISILPVHLFEVTNFKFIDIKNIHTYFLFKTLLLKDYLLCKFNNLKFFKTKKITSYINEIFLAKSLIKFNTYPENNGHFISRRLRWVEVFVPPLHKVLIKTRVTARYHRRVKKKFLDKVRIQKLLYSTRLNQYINNVFLKFYKFYVSAQQSTTSEGSYDLARFIGIKLLKFTKRYPLKRKKIYKLFYKLLKKKKFRRSIKWWNKYRKWFRYIKFKKMFKSRRRYFFKYRKKNRIFSFKALLIKTPKLKIPKIIVPTKITRVRRYPRQFN